jgi:hypothetical protein
MRETARSLREILTRVLPPLREIDESEAARRPAAGKWTKKEILGHLIDSAGNNQQKFVRAMEKERSDFAGYRQDHWVAAQKYNDAGWHDLIVLWQALNLHLAHVIENVDRRMLGHRLSVDGANDATLEFLMRDYLAHLEHHLDQILPAAPREND